MKTHGMRTVSGNRLATATGRGRGQRGAGTMECICGMLWPGQRHFCNVANNINKLKLPSKEFLVSRKWCGGSEQEESQPGSRVAREPQPEPDPGPNKRQFPQNGQKYNFKIGCAKGWEWERRVGQGERGEGEYRLALGVVNEAMTYINIGTRNEAEQRKQQRRVNRNDTSHKNLNIRSELNRDR